MLDHRVVKLGKLVGDVLPKSTFWREIHEDKKIAISSEQMIKEYIDHNKL